MVRLGSGKFVHCAKGCSEDNVSMSSVMEENRKLREELAKYKEALKEETEKKYEMLLKEHNALKLKFERIKTKFENQNALNEKIDESLIGGLVLRMESTMIDSSIKTKLSTLKMIMKGV